MYINKNNLDKKINDIKISSLPFEIFDKQVLNFFDQISKTILYANKYKEFPDLVSFGFWCRKKNLLNIKKKYTEIQIGRGVVFHISPSNIPLNFAYSLAFGLLSGNSNIVRLPSVEFEQVKILSNLIKKIINKKKFLEFKDKIVLISYNRSDEISKILSLKSDARMIWGGDETIKQFKSFETKPRCIDLAFSNRFSIALIDDKKYSKQNSLEKNRIAKNFIKDCFTMDQLGCSSPKAIFWVDSSKKKNKEEFWDKINKILDSKKQIDLVKANNKIYSIHKNILSSQNIYKINRSKFQTVRLDLLKNKKKFDIENFQAGYGTFIEINIRDVKDIKNYISQKCQTITQYGFSSDVIKELIIKNNFIGIDRVVKMGMAFEMSNIWDGYDIVDSLSRKISTI